MQHYRHYYYYFIIIVIIIFITADSEYHATKDLPSQLWSSSTFSNSCSWLLCILSVLLLPKQFNSSAFLLTSLFPANQNKFIDIRMNISACNATDFRQVVKCTDCIKVMFDCQKQDCHYKQEWLLNSKNVFIYVQLTGEFFQSTC